ncbi:MAG TPA: hypothetical protein PKC43_04630 [Phycisphaerales bacterium]|mgnify:CR=1 FL=1|nr:hypothetical protein [Phycisphaerales bacterium]HMP36713.1 hypothetical protein [Phycisphaerales bacterium]
MPPTSSLAKRPSNPRLDRLTSQLYSLPEVIARLGLAIAESQKELNAGFLEAIGRILELAGQSRAPGKPGAANPPASAGDFEDLDAASFDRIVKILTLLMPPRYQFTQTTIDFRADLAERVDLGGSVAGGVAIGAFMVNAGFSASYGHDYRAAARITAVINAYSVAPADSTELISAARPLMTKDNSLPGKTAADAQLVESWKALFELMTNRKLPEAKKENADGGGS